MTDRITAEQMIEADLYVAEVASLKVAQIVESMRWFEQHPGIVGVDYALMQRSGEVVADLNLGYWRNAVRGMRREMAVQQAVDEGRPEWWVEMAREFN